MSARRKTLFDPVAAAGPRSGPDLKSEGQPEEKNSKSGVLSVSACVKLIKNTLSEAFPNHLMVVGEISNLSIPVSGHIYFSLKDTDSSISAVMWKFASKRLKFKPANGMEVVIEAKPDVYDAQGKLQLYVERMTPRGAGALELGFRQMQEKLRGEGLFDADRKKALPRVPRRNAFQSGKLVDMRPDAPFPPLDGIITASGVEPGDDDGGLSDRTGAGRSAL